MKNSSPIGALNTIVKISPVEVDHPDGVRVGVNQLLIKIAGKPAAMPAKSHDSASRNLVGIPIKFEEEANHAYAGIENNAKTKGIPTM